MKILRIIATTILLTAGFICIFAELTIEDTGYKYLIANMIVRTCGVLMIIYAYRIIQYINDIEPLEVEYEDDDMDRKVYDDEKMK